MALKLPLRCEAEYHPEFLSPSESGELFDYLSANFDLTNRSLEMEDGSLLVMGDHSQDRYEHAVPRNPKYTNPRINLTFRKYGWD